MSYQCVSGDFPTDIEALLGGTSAADLPIPITIFPQQSARSKRELTISLRALGEMIESTEAAEKSALPWFKFATFGNRRTEKNCLRNNANVLSVSGVEADYDAGRMSFVEARRRVEAAGICALLYTTPSHTEESPRWRVFAPFSCTYPPAERDRFMARLNGLFDGELAGESFTLSQAYFAGRIKGGWTNVHVMPGRFIDQATQMDSIALPKGACRKAEGKAQTRDDSGSGALFRLAVRIKAEGGTFESFEAAVHEDDAASAHIAKEDSTRSGRGERAIKRAWERAPAHKPVEFDDLDAEPCAIPFNPNMLRFLSPAECVAAPSRGYVLKGLIAPGDIGCIFGAPGVGKSLLAPYLGYCVARGEPAFGMRARAGLVFYVAAEDPAGMRGRVHALHMAHGEANSFALVEGVSDLLSKDSPHLAALRAAAAKSNPTLVVIDTLAMAFPGLEENSAEGMGRVVAVARALAATGPAVILIHHDTKAEGSTPRGHSLFNGALDMALHLQPRDERGVIRGRLTKNRNGSCERDIAFRISTRDGGIDEDGDPISYALCVELPADQAMSATRLTGSEKAALEILADMARTNPNVREEEWRKRCAAGREVSASDTLDSRQKAIRRAIQGLVRAKRVTVADDLAMLTHVTAIVDSFDEA